MIIVVISILSFLIALTVHEFAHAWSADKLGDPNPKLAGRLSLNPLVHLDPLGTVVLPLLLILYRFPIIIGWAKPVEIDSFNFKNIRRDTGLVSLAGPGANLLLATILAVILRLVLSSLDSMNSMLTLVLFLLIRTNIALAVFNLLPIHPLDGGKALVGFLPARKAHAANEFLNQYGQIMLLFFLFPFFGSSLVNRILVPIINILLSFLIPTSTLI
ncbi:site-2 protease family protein [Patescibacteria group bacterium]